MEKKYESRSRERMLNPKQLGKKCSVPSGLALLERRRQIDEGSLAYKALELSASLFFSLPVFTVGAFINADSVSYLLKRLVIAIPLFLLMLYEIYQFKTRYCILAGDVRCYLAHVKDFYDSYADIEFSNGRIEKRFFVYTADGRSVKPGDEVYVCVIEHKNLPLQFCEVRPVSELGEVPRKVSSQKPQKRKKSEKKKKPHAR